MDPTLFGDVSAGMLRFLGIWYNEWGAFLGFLLALVSTFVIFLDSIRQSIGALWYKVAAVVGTLLVLPSLVLRVSPELGNRIGSALVPLAFVGVVGAVVAFLAMITYLAWGRRAEQAQAVYAEPVVGMTEVASNYGGPSFTPPSTPAYPQPSYPSSSTPPVPAPAPSTQAVGSGYASEQPSAPKTQFLKRPPKELSHLIVTSGPRTGQHFPLSEEEGGTNIGRDAQGNEISLDDPQMSRFNSRVRLKNGVFTIYDLASTNGTFVNGQKILEQPLKNGDEVKIGDTFFQFVEVKSKGGPR